MLCGYFPLPNTDSLWGHCTRKTIFALCLDDFGVKYFNQDDANHLINTIKKYYPISLDWEGKNYCGLSLHWNYNNGYVDIDMPGYVKKVLNNHQHPPPTIPQYAPHKWNKPAYGRKTQYSPEPDTSPLLDATQKKKVQSIVGSLLYYAQAIDPSILPALNEISTEQAVPTENTMKKCNMLLDYMHTYPNARMRFTAGTMQLLVDSDAAYLVLPGAKSRFAGHFMLEARHNKYTEHDPPINAPILVTCKTIKNVVCSAAETECGGLFDNGQMAIVIQRTLEAMGHKQQATRIKTDNDTANSFVHSTIRLKQSKTWDMRYNWPRGGIAQTLLKVFWDRGKNNLADYFTKHHAPAHHRIQRYKYILKGFNLSQSGFWARVYSSIMSKLLT